MAVLRRPLVAMSGFVLAVVGTSAGLVGCGAGGKQVGPSNTGQSTTAPTSAPASSPSPTEAHPPSGDVRLLGCTVTDDPYHTGYHSGEFVAVADLKFTNHSGKVSDYSADVEFVDSHGNRVDEGYGGTSKLSPGESQNNYSEDATGTKQISRGTKITCRILSVDRTASTS